MTLTLTLTSPRQVYWLKDGVELDAARDTNLIVTSEGHLIVQQARRADTGNYTCGARNLASRGRTSSSGFLTVFGELCSHFNGDES